MAAMGPERQSGSNAAFAKMHLLGKIERRRPLAPASWPTFCGCDRNTDKALVPHWGNVWKHSSRVQDQEYVRGQF